MSACNVEDPGSVPGLGRSPGEGNGNPLQEFAWRILWTEEPGGLQSMGLQRVGHDQAINTFLFQRKDKHLTEQTLIFSRI